MSSNLISCLLFIIFLTSTTTGGITSNFTKQKNYEDVFLPFKVSQDLSDPMNGDEIAEKIQELQPNTIYYLHVESIPVWSKFIVVQTHVYLHNVTLSYNIEKTENKYVTGQNIGLVQNVSSVDESQFFLENNNPFNVTVLIAVVAYNNNVPVPGGCNLEFAVETAAWLMINLTGATVGVSSQPARGTRGICQFPSLHYQAYHLYLPEKDFFIDTYFQFLRTMMTVKSIQQNGRKVSDRAGGEMHHVYSAYHGTGSVYAVVVTQGTGQSAAYVPALTYTCNPAHYTDSCQVLTSTFSRSLCALVLFLGLFICLFGHSFFQTELFLMSTLMGGILFYIAIARNGMSDSTNVVLASVGGVTVGNLWLLLWWIFGSPMLSLIMATLLLGFLLTSLLFYRILGDVVYMESDVNYWLTFLCGVLVVSLLLMPYTNRVNILACSVVGSYAAIVPVDHYVGANLKYIFINILRRATVPGFSQALIDPPFQMKDGILVTLWTVLAVVGFVMQSQRFGDRPAFPPSPQFWGSHSSVAHSPLLSEQRPLLHGQPVTASPGSDSVFT